MVSVDQGHLAGVDYLYIGIVVSGEGFPVRVGHGRGGDCESKAGRKQNAQDQIAAHWTHGRPPKALDESGLTATPRGRYSEQYHNFKRVTTKKRLTKANVWWHS